MTFNDFVLGVNYAILGYFFLINAVYLFLYVISFAEITDYVRREVFSGLTELFTSNYALPVSVIVPAYNEEATIVASVRSFLALQYPLFEVVVVNDGSKDRTIEVLREEFQLKTQPIKGVYAS